LLKRNAMAAPFERAFDAQSLAEQEDHWDPSSSQLMTIHYRDDEAIYVQNQQDRVTVIFSTLFKEETDRVFAKVFLQVYNACSPLQAAEYCYSLNK
jgi:actin related protein 2/3 complex subunit 2